MKVLQVCYVYPPLFSGYGKQLDTVNRGIIKNHKNIDILVHTAYGSVSSRSALDRITIKSFFRSGGKRKGIYYYLYAVLSSVRWLKDFYGADVVHMVKAGPEIIIPIIMCLVHKKKFVVKVAQDELESLLEGRRTIRKKIRLYFLLKSSLLVCISSKIKREAYDLGFAESRVISIPNCVDFNRFNFDEVNDSTASIAAASFSAMKRYIYVGAISKRKGIDDLLAALKLYTGMPISFTFIGPLYDIEDFQNKIDSLNPSFVSARYIGETDRPEHYMRDSDCLVLPSYSEGMPNVILEGMACGLYILASDIEVNKEICVEGSGDVFRVGDVRNILEKIIKFSMCEYGAAAKYMNSERARALYSVETISDEYAKAYISLWEGAPNEA